jgi:hypothetical protein
MPRLKLQGKRITSLMVALVKFRVSLASPLRLSLIPHCAVVGSPLIDARLACPDTQPYLGPSTEPANPVESRRGKLLPVLPVKSPQGVEEEVMSKPRIGALEPPFEAAHHCSEIRLAEFLMPFRGPSPGAIRASSHRSRGRRRTPSPSAIAKSEAGSSDRRLSCG